MYKKFEIKGKMHSKKQNGRGERVDEVKIVVFDLIDAN